jgi:hypothetical protein
MFKFSQDFSWVLEANLYMNPTKYLIEANLYMNPTKNLIELKHYMKVLSGV